MDNETVKKAKANLSGELAEKAVRKVFGLEEPQVEVKSARKRNWHVVIGLTQLEQCIEDVYCVVVYERGPRGKGKKATYTIKEAYKRPLEFIFIPATEVAKQAIKQRHQLRAVTSSTKCEVKFYVYLSLKQLRERAGNKHQHGKHTVYGHVPEPLPPF